MPTYEVEDPKTGTVLELDGDSPPTELELEEIFSNLPDPVASTNQTPPVDPYKSNLFPSRMALQERDDKGEEISAPATQGALATLSDAFGAPTRAAATLRGQEMSDPDAYAFRPETEKYKTAIDENLPESAPFTKGVLKAGTELVGRTISDPILFSGFAKGVGKAVTEGAGKLASAINKGSGRLAQELSGVSEEALRLASTKAGRRELRNASGRQAEIGSKLTDAFDDFHNYLPEKEVIESALKNMPEVDISGAIKVLQDAKIKPASNGAMLKHEREANAEIDQLIQDLTGRTRGKFPTTKLPAAEAYDIRKRLDYDTDFNLPYAKLVNTARLKARTQLKNDLLSAAGKSGNPEYAKAMKDFSDKLKLKEKILTRLGKTSNVREGRSEAFVANLFGKNSANKQDLLKDLDKVFGTDLLKQSKMTFLANELGDEGKAALLPRQTTGRATLSAAGGGLAGLMASPAVGAAVGGTLAAHASPAVASRAILPATQAVENFINQGLLKSPKAKALGKAFERAPSEAAKLRVYDQILKEIQKEE